MKLTPASARAGFPPIKFICPLVSAQTPIWSYNFGSAFLEEEICCSFVECCLTHKQRLVGWEIANGAVRREASQEYLCSSHKPLPGMAPRHPGMPLPMVLVDQEKEVEVEKKMENLVERLLCW